MSTMVDENLQKHQDFVWDVVKELRNLGIEPGYVKAQESLHISISLSVNQLYTVIIEARNNGCNMTIKYPDKTSNDFIDWANRAIEEIKNRVSLNIYPNGYTNRSHLVAKQIYITLLAFRYIFTTKPLVFNEIRKIVNRAEEEFYSIFPNLDRIF